MATPFRDLLNWYAKLGPRAKGRVPYRHVAQLGDPVLRGTAENLHPDFVTNNDTKRNIYMLKHVMDRYGAVGLAAPQIGVRHRIFAMEFEQHQVNPYSEVEKEIKGIKRFPLTVFINPKMKIIDRTQVVHSEACESIRGFCADVPRFKEVSITALNEDGEEFTIQLKDWLARIAQHEMDHLNGQVYTDIMLKETFHCSCWQDVNEYGGKISLPYAP